MSMSRTLLALMVPEAEPLVGDLRARLDPAAKLGLGAHITLVYPFLDSERITHAVADRLRTVAAARQPLAFHLDAVRMFPSTVWLAPSPAAAIGSLAAALQLAFPERPRRDREFPDYVPHVSVAREVRRDRGAIAATLEERLHASGPVPCMVRHVHVMERAPEGWQTRLVVELGGPS
ncbi:2'-5' RNA ligase family protein [Luteibacter sp.]|jgi:2'-5' RNA ligase|uniref:2'-5' RNA ligase family protein n=1 Tax=Luteibacter sp. TaxID=1886636 RepID=UPI002F3EDD0E